MHIVHLSTRRDFYGAEVCLANLATGMVARGHQVSCLVQPGSELAGRLAGGAVDVVPMPLLDWFDPGTISRVSRWLRRRQPHILATHLPRDYFIAGTASLGLPVCNIATRHRLKPLSLPFLKRPFLRDFGAMVAVSDAVAKGIHHARLVRPERVITVPNGVVAPDPKTVEGGLRARAGIPASAPVIGLVGKLCSDKGADFLLRAVARISVDWPDFRVILVGDSVQGDVYYEQLQALVQTHNLAGRVHFLGFVPDAAAYVREFDVQVVASPAEPFGLVTLEAMASKVPVVATAAGGSPEIIRDGVEGFLVAPGDVQALANRLACLLGSPGLRREMGQRGRARFEAKYTVEQMVAQTEAVYEQALARRRNRAGDCA